MRGEPVQSNALAAEVAVTHPEIAAKLSALDELYARLTPDAGGHRPITAEERAIQVANTLTMDEMRLVQEIEYGTYVANQNIHHGVALAYVPGHPVPVSNVAAHGYLRAGLVDRVRPLPGDDAPAVEPADAPAEEPAPAAVEPADDDTSEG